MQNLNALLGHTDIYLIDQMLKGRYAPPQRILDAGAGAGRNLQWFVSQGFEVYAIDREVAAIQGLREQYPLVPPTRWSVGTLENIPFSDQYFDHIICSAVLHFADSPRHFADMMHEMTRVLRPGGTLFIRMTCDQGLPPNYSALGNGRFALADGTDRFLLTPEILAETCQRLSLQFVEPFKTVLVEQLRSMAVLVLQK